MDDSGVGVQGPSEGAVGADRRVFPLHKVFVLVGRYDGRTNTVCAVSAFVLDGVCVVVINGGSVVVINGGSVIVINDMCVIVINGGSVIVINGGSVIVINDMCVVTLDGICTLTFHRTRSITKSIARIRSKDLHKQTIIGRVDDLTVAHVKTTW